MDVDVDRRRAWCAMFEKGLGMRLLKIALMGTVGFGASAGAATANGIYEACRDGRINAQSVLSSWMKAGVARNFKQAEGSGTVSVVTSRWEQIGEKAQVSIGIAAYCFVADSLGNGYVQISGSRQETLGTVVNGNWSAGR